MARWPSTRRCYDPAFPHPGAKFLQDQPATPKCLTNAELTGLRRAFERYGTGDGFWMNYRTVLDAATLRDGCDWRTVNNEMRAAYKKWTGEDAEFL